MDREADAGGIGYWKDVLKTKSRETVMNDFAYSEEFKKIMASYGL